MDSHQPLEAMDAKMKIRTSMNAIVSISTLTCMLTLTACGSPPKREPYAGVDQVGEINKSQMVGDWNIIVLNPVADEDKSTITTSYKSDGTWTSTVIPPEEQNRDLGPMKFAGEGSWQIDGDSMLATMNNIEETTGHKLGGFMTSVMSLFMSKMSGTANAYEMSADRMVFVHEETGQATLLVRR